MNYLELKILFYNDETAQLEDLGIKFDINSHDVKKMSFFNIEAVSPYVVEDRNYSIIHSNADEFVCIDNYEKVLEKILTTKLLTWNK